MTSLPEPFVSLIINGVDVGSELAPYTLDFTYTDHLHGKADEIAVKLRDDQGLWRGPWRPEKDDEVVAAIGYRGGIVMPCGTFRVDIPKASGKRAEDIVDFRAVSAFHSKALRTQKTETYEDKSLADIVRTVASRNGLSVVGEIEDVHFKRRTQRRLRDLRFLLQLGEDYGHFVGVKGDQLLFTKRAAIDEQAPVRVFDLVPGSGIIDWSFEEQSEGTYSKAKAQYLDPDAKETVRAEASDPSVSTGDTLNIDERVESKAQAEKLCKGRLAKANENKRTGTLTIVGDPLAVAGQIVRAGSTFGKYAGLYRIDTSTHSLKRADYPTKLDLKGVDGK